MVWLWVIVTVLIVGSVAVVAVGRDTEMADVYEDRPDVPVAAHRPLTSEDLRDISFTTAVRGYRMDEVDALIDRLRAQLSTASRAAETDVNTRPDSDSVVRPADEAPEGEHAAGDEHAPGGEVTGGSDRTTAT